MLDPRLGRYIIELPIVISLETMGSFEVRICGQGTHLSCIFQGYYMTTKKYQDVSNYVDYLSGRIQNPLGTDEVL